jgi:hypothetical protein
LRITGHSLLSAKERASCIGIMGTACRDVTVIGTPCSKQNAYTAAAAARSNSLFCDVSGAQPATALGSATSPPCTATARTLRRTSAGCAGHTSAKSRRLENRDADDGDALRARAREHVEQQRHARAQRRVGHGRVSVERVLMRLRRRHRHADRPDADWHVGRADVVEHAAHEPRGAAAVADDRAQGEMPLVVQNGRDE